MENKPSQQQQAEGEKANPSISTGLNTFQKGNSEQNFTPVSAKMEHTESGQKPPLLNTPFSGELEIEAKEYADMQFGEFFKLSDQYDRGGWTGSFNGYLAAARRYTRQGGEQ